MYKFEAGAHVHTYDGQPLVGTTTLIKEVMPPFLAKWGGQCAVDFLKEEYKTEASNLVIPVDKFHEMLDKAVNAWTKVRNKAATKGVDMHAKLEEYVQHCIDRHEGVPREVFDPENEHKAVAEFSKWACENVQKFIFSEANTYSKRLWVGGVVDCLAIMKGGQYAIIDFKSGKDTYFSSVAQVAGYALQLEESGYGDANGGNWQQLTEPIHLLIIVPFGAKTFKPTTVENVAGFKEVFEHLAAVYGFLQAFNKRDK